jgi:hypothetical protein
MLQRIGLVTVLGALALACSNPTDDKANVLPSLKADAVGLASDATASNATCGCLAVGQWFRFDTLKLKSLDGKADHPVIPTLNNLWQQDIDHFELNFYVKIEEVTDGKVKLRVVNGARTDEPPNPDDTVCSSSDDLAKQKPTTCLLDNPAKLDTTTLVELPRSKCQMSESAAAGINVYAGTPANTKNCAPTLPVKHAIPIRNAVLTGRFNDDCTQMLDGQVLAGSFAKAALSKICTCLTVGKQLGNCCAEPDPNYVDSECGGCNSHYQNLQSLLEAFSGGSLDYGCKSEDGSPAVCLTASFTAQRLDAPPPSCP